MPRKTKEQKELEDKKTTKKSTTTKAKKATTTKKTATKKVSTAKTKKVDNKNKPTKKATTKKSTSKTTSTKKSTAKKPTTKKKTTTSRKKVDIVEYYDLPYRYNQTVVKVLIIHNNTLGYSFEVEINDFANSWYLNVSDSKCDYKIELGRRPIFKNENLNSDYIYITTSNEIESPNDRILFDKNQKMVYFRNVKTGQLTAKDISSISFIRNMGKIYNIYDLYKAIYNDENVEDIYDLKNPSSGNPSSNTFSSKYR